MLFLLSSRPGVATTVYIVAGQDYCSPRPRKSNMAPSLESPVEKMLCGELHDGLTVEWEMLEGGLGGFKHECVNGEADQCAPIPWKLGITKDTLIR